MIIKQYNTRFTRLTETDAEMVRIWRNSAGLSRYMHFRGQISPEDQRKWFRSIDNTNNYYFIIEHNNLPCGLVYQKNIDHAAKRAEGGILIADTALHETPLAVASILFIMDFGFFYLGLDHVYGHVLKDNRRADENYQRLGFMSAGENERSYFREASFDSYNSKAKKIRMYLCLIEKCSSAMEITFENDPEDLRPQAFSCRYKFQKNAAEDVQIIISGS